MKNNFTLTFTVASLYIPGASSHDGVWTIPLQGMLTMEKNVRSVINNLLTLIEFSKLEISDVKRWDSILPRSCDHVAKDVKNTSMAVLDTFSDASNSVSTSSSYA